MIEIRTAQLEDAASLAKVIESAEQAGTMLFAPNERQLSEEQAKKMIASFTLLETSQLFVAVDKTEVIGYLIVKGETPSRVRHRGYIVIGIAQHYRGQGVGQALFTHAFEWAQSIHIRKLELTVIQSNTAAVKLYEKVGFEIEGYKKHSLVIDGKFVDEYFMGKSL